MRFGLIHRIMTDALAVLGILALVTSGELPRLISSSIVLGLIVALAVPERWQSRKWLKRVSTIGPLVLLAVQLGRLFVGGSALELAVEFAAALQIIRLATRRGAAHDQQVIVLSLLHLIAGTVLGGGLGYGLSFLGFLIIAPGALVLSHLRREVEGNYRQGARDRTGLPVDVPRILRSRRVVGRSFLVSTCLLSVPIFVFTASLFVLFPRVGLSLLLLNRSRTGRMIGFSDHVNLGEVGTLRSDPTIALRLEIPDLPSPPPQRLALHLRGAAFDSYDGRSWSRTNLTREPVSMRDGGIIWVKRAPDPLRDRIVHVDLEPIDPPVLFLPASAVALHLRRRGDPVLNAKLEVAGNSEGEYRYTSTDDRGVQYDVYLGSDGETSPDGLSAADQQRYLAVPASLPSRIADLARSATQGALTPIAKAQAIEEFLLKGYAYDLASPSGSTSDPLDDFLFHSHRGHCEFYSTAMVILLRAVGVPARNVTGFIGGSYNRFGHYYAVRQGDAHSWVEVFLDGRGWQTFDPTPPSDAAPKSELTGVLALVRDVLEATSQRWDRYVIGYDLRQQVYLFESMSHIGSRRARRHFGLVFVIGGVIAMAGAAYWLWRRRGIGLGKAMGPKDPRHRERSLATALYEALEIAMSAQGISRGPGTPPLRHARSLQVLQHPLADEILELTNVYLASRFGGEPLSEDGRRRFEGRVRALRSAKITNALAS